MNLRKRHFSSRSSLKQPNTYWVRYAFIIVLLIIAALALIARLIDLTVVNRHFLQTQGDERTLRTIEVPTHRGMILDRNGEPLAISTPVDSVWVNPKEFNGHLSKIIQLATLLGEKPTDLMRRINESKKREFLYLKRDINPNLGDAVAALKIPGVYLQSEFKRYYPEGEVTAHILGFTNVDDTGQEGLELAYDAWLAGLPGLEKVLKDRYGHIVQNIGVIKAPKPGQNLVLSIDRRIQFFAYRELIEGIQKYQAESGSVVVIDVKTGEILAMVNGPSYNPNDRSLSDSSSYRNRAVTDTFEPGSTIKTFSMVNALQSGKYHVDSRVDTSPGVLILDGDKKVTDDKINNGIIDLSTILKVSSNVGMSKITLSLPPESWWNVMHRVGFGQVTDSSFPGERAGLLPNYAMWDPFVLATMSFGYSETVTLLQLAQAYTILAAKGMKRPVTFLKIDSVPTGQQVIDPVVAQNMLVMLESVLTKGGTAPLARVPGYRVTGKTGTVHLVGPQGYEKNHYNSLFVGVAPASDPRLVVAVILHDPQSGQYYGGYTAGPIFSRIMGESLQLLDVPPDDLASLNQKPTAVTAPPAGMAD